MKKILLITFILFALVLSISMVGQRQKIRKDNTTIYENRNLGEFDIPEDNGI